MSWTEHYAADGVVMGEYEDNLGAYLVVADEQFEHYRITLGAHGDEFHVGIDLAWREDPPGQLANYSEHVPSSCRADEITIDSAGLFTIMARQKTAAHVDFRQGCTLQLSTAYIEPIQMAVAMLRDRVKGAVPQEGINWWNGLSEGDRRHWMKLAGDTGCAADASAAFLRHEKGPA